MGGRGTGSSIAKWSRLAGITEAQNRTIEKLVKRTANLKKEQYRIIDSEGNVILEKHGKENEVAATVGEKRENLNGNISLHNHPQGGTFSSDDINEFGYGAKGITVASPEGEYRLVNKEFGTRKQYDGWQGLQNGLVNIKQQGTFDRLKQARKNTANTKTAKQLKAINDKFSKIQKEKGNDAAVAYAQTITQKYNKLSEQHKKEVQKEDRRLLVQPYHDYLKANAGKYGFKYQFTKK